jgi:hypothetical protein
LIRRRKPLREDNLKNVARPDIILGALDHLEKALFGRVRARRIGGQGRTGMGPLRERAFEGGDHGCEAFQRTIVGGVKRAISVRA